MSGLITNYITHGSGVPSGNPGVPAGEYAFYWRTSTSHLYVWDGAAWTDATGGGGGGSGLYSAYLCYQEQQASGTTGGTFTSGAWQTRTLNTEVADTGNHGALASNQVTLDAGTYLCHIAAPAFRVDRHQVKLRNITDSADVFVGITNYASNAGNAAGMALAVGRFTIAGAKVLEVQHRCDTSESGNGLGLDTAFSVSAIFTTLELWKE